MDLSPFSGMSEEEESSRIRKFENGYKELGWVLEFPFLEILLTKTRNCPPMGMVQCRMAYSNSRVLYSP